MGVHGARACLARGARALPAQPEKGQEHGQGRRWTLPQRAQHGCMAQRWVGCTPAYGAALARTRAHRQPGSLISSGSALFPVGWPDVCASCVSLSHTYGTRPACSRVPHSAAASCSPLPAAPPSFMAANAQHWSVGPAAWLGLACRRWLLLARRACRGTQREPVLRPRGIVLSA